MGKFKSLVSVFAAVAIFASCIYFPMHTVAESRKNLLKGASVSANPEYYNGWYEYNRPLSALTDGVDYVGVGYNAGNMLATPYAVDGTAFINFKVDSEITINKLIFYFVGSAAAPSNAVTDYAVDVKLADQSWKRVAEKHTESYTEWDAKVETLCFEEVTTDEITITINNSKGQSYVAIYEIEAFLDESITSDDYTPLDPSDDTLPMPTPINILSGKTASCSSGYNDWYLYNRPVSKLTDGKYEGNAAEMWASDYNDGYAYFEFNFDKEVSINKVITSFPGSAAGVVDKPASGDTPAKVLQVRDYAVDGLLADGSWVRLAERHIDSNDEAIDYYTDTVIFESKTVKKLRFTFANAYEQEWVAVREVEAYYDSMITPDEYTPINCKDFTKYAIIKPEYKNLILNAEITANEAYYNGWYPENRALSNLTDGKTFVGVGYNAGSATVIPYEEDGYAYINFKLKEKSILNKLVIHFPGTSAYAKEQQVSAYAVEVKNENEWKRVAVRNIENSDNWDAYSDIAIFNKSECEEIRIVFVKSKAQTELSLFEVEFFSDNMAIDIGVQLPELPTPQLPEPEKPGPENESTNILKDSAEITANKSYYNGWYPENRALSNLIDGNTFVGVGYNAGSAAVIPYEADGDTYVNFKLKNKTTINQLVVYFPGTSAYSKEQQVKCYVVEVKTGGKWKRVAVRNIENNDNWDAYYDIATFNKVECNEIRVIFIKAKGQETVALFEIEVYYDPEQKDTNKPLESIPELPKNILNESSNITANDAYYNGWYPIYRSLSKSVDGNSLFKFDASKATMIPYGSNKHAYIQFSFGNVVKANRLTIYLPDAGKDNTMTMNNRITDYAVDVKLKDGSWTRIIEQHNERVEDWDIYYEEYLFETVEFTAIRLISKATDNQAYLAISELELIYDSESEDEKPYMERFLRGASIYKTEKINNSIFGTEKEIEMPISSVLSGIIPTVGLGDNSWFSTERPLKNITDGIQDVFTPEKISTIDYHASVAYYNFEFTSPQKINTFRFFVPQKTINGIEQRPTDFAVDVLLIDGTWKRVAEQHIKRNNSEEGYCETLVFSTEECMGIRLTSLASEKMDYFALSEVEAYYNPYLKKAFTGVNKTSDSSKEIPLPKIRVVPTPKFS